MPLGATLGYNTFLNCQPGSYSSKFQLLSTSATTDFYNQTASGGYRFYSGIGVNNSAGTQTININTYGRTVFQQGGTFVDNQQARVSVNSTAEGFSVPQMTTTQRDLIKGLVTATITSSGSGQTNGTSIPVVITSPTGSGAVVLAQIVGGAIIAVAITAPGNGYSGTGTGTVANGGTPGTISFTLNTTEGIEIYNLTTHQKQYYNGTTWVSY